MDVISIYGAGMIERRQNATDRRCEDIDAAVRLTERRRSPWGHRLLLLYFFSTLVGIIAWYVKVHP